jgi:hypothetical protein
MSAGVVTSSPPTSSQPSTAISPLPCSTSPSRSLCPTVARSGRIPLWSHPRIWLTPYVASVSLPEGGVELVIGNAHRDRHSEPLLGVVERHRDY